MFQRVCVLFVGLLTAGQVAAQDEIIKDFQAAHVEIFLKEVLKVNASKMEFPKENRVSFQTPAEHFDFHFYGGAKKRIELEYHYGDLKPSEAHIVAWNKIVGRQLGALLVKDTAALTGTVSLEAGVSFKQLKFQYDKLLIEKAAFEAFVKQPLAAKDLVRQAFPAKADKPRTSWDIEWDMVPNRHNRVHLLRIVKATFNFKDKNNQAKSIVVARNIELVEAFASYHDGQTAYLDLASETPAVRANKTVAAEDGLKGPPCVAPSEILTYSKNDKLKIFREVHDDGLRWMGGNNKNNAYRGEKLVLMSIFQAVNYVYFIEYDFTDDGRIVCRLGFTAHNLGPRGRGRDNGVVDGDVHLHVGCWRMEFDLGDPINNTGGLAKNDYRLISQRFHGGAKPRYRVDDEPFGANAKNKAEEAVEGSALWKAEDFTTLRVRSTEVKNAHGLPIAYDLIPTRLGSVRDLRAIGDASGGTDFVNFDFFVTRTAAPQPFYHKVPGVAKQNRTLPGHPATVWYSAPALHVPRGEDFGKNGKDQLTGVALATWIEFTLRPRDLFDSTPLYP